MEDNTFIKYTRSLHTNKIFKSFSFEYRHIFMTILVNMAFKPMKLNDHGEIIELQPGQMMTTQRELVKLCDEKRIDKSKIHRALQLFENVGFSKQETRHTKTIITITESSICESLNKQIEPRIEPRSNQDRTKIEPQKKKEKKEEKEKTTPPNPQKGDRVVVLYDCLKENKDLNEDEKECLMQYPENRVKLALKFAETEKPNTTLIQMLVWHCQAKVPPQPSGKRLTEQQKMALEFNKFLPTIGHELLYEQNKALIEEGGYVNTPFGPRSLKNDTRTLRQDFDEIKSAFRREKQRRYG